MCAHTLGIAVDMVRSKPATSDIIPNDFVSGGSIASEACCFVRISANMIFIYVPVTVEDEQN